MRTLPCSTISKGAHKLKPLFCCVNVSPAEMFQNRLEVDSIELNYAIEMDANQLIVVYKQLEGKIERRIVKGPLIFIPSAHEW